MDSLNFNVSDELQTILKKAHKIVEENKDSVISIELVTYLILDEYINNGAKESETIVSVLNEYTMSNKEAILDLCRAEYQRVKVELPENILTDSGARYAVCEFLESAFKKARVANELRKRFFSENTNPDVITTQSLLMWGILFEDKCNLVGELNRLFEFNKEKFVAQEITDNIFNTANDSKPVLKTKRIESKEEEEKPQSPEEIQNSIKDDDEKFERAASSGAGESISVNKRDPNSKTPTLDQYGLNMTKKAADGGYDPLVGREKEISQIIEILCCRKKNNAALLGDAGVGKTAIVEGLAQRIAQKKVPMELRNKKIFSISITDLQAGTIYRGQLEERIQDLCNEVRESEDVIVYIDEFHQAVSEGSSNIAQMLKPALARGEMNMIISTTTSEYRRFIEKDAALKRRFEPVQVDEPTISETIDILKGIAQQYSNFHHVTFTEDVLKKCAEWSGQYITDRQFPDKAIGILDMSASLTKLDNPIDYSKREEMKKNIDELNKKADEAISEAEFERASDIRDARIKIEAELKALIESQEKDTSSWPEVTVESVSKVISKISGVPIDKIKSSNMKKLKEIKDSLGSKVIGQDEAIEELTVALQRNILGLRDPHKPIASFLLVGPTGVGKALVNGTPVLTSQGWINIEDIKVGDLVQTPYNGYSRVSGVYPQGIKNTIYRIHFRDGRSIDTDENHLWQIRTPKQQKNYRISKGDNLRHSYTMSTKEMFDIAQSRGGFTTKNDGYLFGIPVFPGIEHDEKDFIIPPYVLGVLLGDGCLTERTKTRLIISSNEPDIIERCAQQLDCKYRLHSDLNYNNILFGDKLIEINSKIKEYGLNVKSINKFIPEDYLIGSKKQRLDLLSGLIDTDGTVTNSGKILISTGSERLCKDIIYLCRSLGYIATSSCYSRTYRKNDDYVIRISTNDPIYYSDKHKDSVKDIKRNREYFNDRLVITNIEKFVNVVLCICRTVNVVSLERFLVL